jgi:hypothetical protein
MADHILNDNADQGATKSGADAFMQLMQAVRATNNETFNQYNEDKEGHPGSEDIDGRDYPAMVEATRSSILANLTNADSQHSTGYLRAMADLLCLAVEGFTPGADWNPLQTTEPAFILARLARLARNAH